MRLLTLLILIGLGCSQGTEAEPIFHEELLTKSELDALPHVRDVRTLTAGQNLGFQIIHIRNWHFIDRKAFEADGGKDWEAFLDSVEAVQKQQAEVLRRLRDDHRIKAVFLEGLTDADADDYRKLAVALEGWKEPAGDDPLSQFLRQQHREDLLLLGAAARVDGLEILAAEDAEALEAGDPQKPGFDSEANERREDAIVRRLRNSGHRVAVLILGGDHDLMNNVVMQIEGNVAYARFQVEAHHKAETESSGY